MVQIRVVNYHDPFNSFHSSLIYYCFTFNFYVFEILRIEKANKKFHFAIIIMAILEKNSRKNIHVIRMCGNAPGLQADLSGSGSRATIDFSENSRIS